MTMPTPNQDRLDNWHVLQELAGLRGKGAGKTAAKKAPAKPAAPPTTNGNGHKPAGSELTAGTRIKYNDGSKWTGGVLKSVDPVVLSLDDNSELRITKELLDQAVGEGLIASVK